MSAYTRTTRFVPSRGFTTIEILIVVGILVMMVAASAAVVSRTQISSQLVDTRDSVVQQLRYARTQSLARAHGTAHGVFVSSTAITAYRGDSYESRDAQFDTIIAYNGLSLTGGTVTPTTSATNIALGQPASAESEYSASYAAENANDGNDNNFWIPTAGTSNGAWWQVDLGAPTTMTRAEVRWYNAAGTYNCTDFEILGSNSPTTFSDVLWSGNTVGAQEQVYVFSPTTYRYWRFSCVAANNVSFVVIREVRMYGQEFIPADPDFVFEQGTGVPSNTGTIQIAHPVYGLETLSINEAGTVSY